jgi:23S rRNA pseudouridine2605 synthase
VRLLKRGRSRAILQIVLKEGRNRQIRRVLARLGHPVRDLVRTRIGHLSLKGLPIGQARRLTADEVQYLKGLGEQPAPPEQAPGAQRHAPGQVYPPWRAGRLTKERAPERGGERRRRTFSREPKGERAPSRQAPGAKRRQPNDRHRP